MGLQQGNRLAVLTSGGDSPGMNAAVRAVVRVASAHALDVVGIQDGYRGLLEEKFASLDLSVLDENSRRGGTILGTTRSKVFPTPEGQTRAREVIRKHNIHALVVIGGNGSLSGAKTLLNADVEINGKSAKLAVGGIPASIDNDLACTSMSIGVDTAMNTIVEACDRICDTASAHRRAFFVEVMGRDSGYLAMTTAIAAGADVVLIPETGTTEESIVQQVVSTLVSAFKRPEPKRRVLVVKSEGVKIDSAKLKSRVDEIIAKDLPDVDTRVSVLGHVVRGGQPTAFDRLLGARLANATVRALIDGQTGFMAGWVGPGISRMPTPYDPYVVLTPLEEVLAETAKLMSGESELARWRKRVFQQVAPILAQ